MNIIDEIKSIVDNHGKSYASLIGNCDKYSSLKKYIFENTKCLSGDHYNLKTRIYWILNGYRTFDDCKCPVCGGHRIDQNVISIEKGYPFACSRKCAASSDERKNKTISTCQKKYGSDSFLGSERGLECKKDWLDKNGVENTFQIESIKEKSRISRKNSFGYEYTMQSPEKRKLVSENYLNKTGYDSQFKNPDVILKIKNTVEKNKKLGIDSRLKFKENSRRKRYMKFLENEEISPNFEEDCFCRLDSRTQYTTPLSWHCNRCGNDFVSLLDANYSSREHRPARCPTCHPMSNSGFSKMEVELGDFIKENYSGRIEENTKNIIPPFELDLFLEERKLAFEFDGLYWHSEDNGKGRFYHLSKTEMCEKKGIKLVHVFEDEWLFKTDIVKSRIKNLLGIYDTTVFARKCSVKNVDNKTAMEFLEENHIQGRCSSSVNLGLFYKNDLVSLMTFGKSRFSKKYEYELIRFCNKLGYHVPGGASKLLKHFENEYSPSSLVSYADRRWSNGNLYGKLGFNFSHNSLPDYFYVKDQRRFSRIVFQKHKLENLLENFNGNETEVENMKNNGYTRIFDCGNMVFTKTYKL